MTRHTCKYFIFTAPLINNICPIEGCGLLLQSELKQSWIGTFSYFELSSNPFCKSFINYVNKTFQYYEEIQHFQRHVDLHAWHLCLKKVLLDIFLLLLLLLSLSIDIFIWVFSNFQSQLWHMFFEALNDPNFPNQPCFLKCLHSQSLHCRHIQRGILTRYLLNLYYFK